MWDGGPLNGKTILLTTEQGFGDVLLTARYVPMVKARGGRVLMECHPELQRLLSGLEGIDGFVRAGTAYPAYDVHCPLMSLPHRLGTTIETVPPPTRLTVPAEAREKAARLVPGNDGTVKVGIIWSGRVTFKDNARRATLAELGHARDALAATRASLELQLARLADVRADFEHARVTHGAPPPAR